MRALARLIPILAAIAAAACMPDTDAEPAERTSGAESPTDDSLLIDSDGRIDDDDPMTRRE